MSRVRNTWIHDADGNAILLDGDSRLPVSSYIYDANGDPIVLDGDSRIPASSYTYDAAGNAILLDGDSRLPVTSYLHDATGNQWHQDANGGMPVNLEGIEATGGGRLPTDSNIYDSDGNKILLDADERLPTTSYLYGANGLPWNMEPNGGMPVNKQDQTTPVVMKPVTHIEAITTLAAPVVEDTYTCTVTDPTGFIAGDELILTSEIGSRFYFSEIISVAGSVITVGTPFDYAYEAGQQATCGNDNMAVDGSGTRQIFSLRASEPPAGLDVTFDITTIKITCVTSTSPILTDFGDIAGGITNGLVCRRTDGSTINYFNVKTNAQISNIADFQIITASPSGVDGFIAELPFNGDENMGAVVRMGKFEDFEFLVQDDLTDLVYLGIMVKGHIVSDAVY